MKKVIIGLVIALSVFILGSLVLYQRASAPYAQARNETVTFLTERSDLAQSEDFYWYNGEETIFSVRGYSEQEEEKLYIVKQNGGEIRTYDVPGTMTEQEAIRQTRQEREPKRILNAKVGWMNDRPIWEVTYKNDNDRLGYYIIDLETGEWVRTIENI